MKYIYWIIIASSLIWPFHAFAHIGGNAQVDGDYRIELGSFPESDLDPSKTIIFSAVMEDLDANPVYSTKAWIRISQENTILFSSADLETEDGTIDFEYKFPDNGTYEMMIRMINLENDDEATVTFPLEIGDLSLVGDLSEGSLAEQKGSRFNLAVLTLIIGLLVGVFLARYRPKVTEVN